MLSLSKTQWIGIFSILFLMLFVLAPDAMAFVPQKPNIDLGEIVNQGDSIDTTLGNLAGYAIMIVAVILGIGILIAIVYAAYNAIMRLIDENDKFDIKNAVILIFVVAIIGIAGIAIAYIVFDLGLSMRGS